MDSLDHICKNYGSILPFVNHNTLASNLATQHKICNYGMKGEKNQGCCQHAEEKK